jgi:hypothetical protein
MPKTKDKIFQIKILYLLFHIKKKNENKNKEEK